MSVSSSFGFPIPITTTNINATGSITAGNSFYVNGNGNDRYYLSNSGNGNDDAIYSYAVGNYFYSLIDTHDQLQLRAVNSTNNAQVPFVIQNNLLPGANVGGSVIFNCVGANGNVPINVRPEVANYNIMTNAVPSLNELITYYDYLNLRGTTTNYTTFQINHNLISAVPYTAGVLTIPSAGLYSINTNVGYTASGTITLFQISLTNLPPPYINASQSIYSDVIPSEDPTIPISAEQQISLTTNAYFPAQTTINLVILSTFGSGNVTLNNTAKFPDLYFNALRIG